MIGTMQLALLIQWIYIEHWTLQLQNTFFSSTAKHL